MDIYNEYTPKTGALRDFIKQCPFLRPTADGQSFIYMDSLPAGPPMGEPVRETVSYCLSVVPSALWYKRYTDGGGLRQIDFVFRSNAFYDANGETQNTANIEFFERFCAWLNFMRGKSEYFIDVSPLTGGYCLDVDDSGERAVYQLQGRALFYAWF